MFATVPRSTLDETTMNSESTLLIPPRSKPDYPVWLFFLIGVGFLVIAGVLDVYRPFGKSWSILYVLVAFYAGWFLRGRAEVVLLATIALAAMFVPSVFNWEEMRHGRGLFYRFTGVCASLIMVALIWDRRRFFIAMQRANIDLEQKVFARTAELQAANETLRREILDRHKSEESLRNSERRFALFMDYLPGLAWIKDDQGRYVYANRAAVKVFRVPLERLFGKTDDDLFPCDLAENFKRTDRQAISSRMAVATIESLICDDGTAHFFVVSKFPLPTPDGQSLLIGGMATDITERQQAEDTIRKISAFREAIIRTAAEGICFFYPITESPFIIFSVWNEEMTRITGYTMDEINRLGWYQAMYSEPEAREQARLRMDRMRHGDDVKSEEWEITRKNGEQRTVSTSSSVVETDDGVNGVVAIMQDVTKRKRAEFALNESESRFRLLFEGANDAIMLADAETGLITQCNVAAEDLLGRERHEIIGQTQTFLHPPEDTDKYKAMFQEHARTKEKTLVEAEILRKNGQKRVVSISPSVTTIGRQNVIQGVFRDITEQKRAAETLEMTRFCVDQAADSIFWVSRDGRFLYVNDAACKDRGYCRDELLSKSIFDLDVESNYQPDLWESHFEDLKRRGSITLETRHRTRDGRIFPVEVNANYVHIGDNEFNFAFVRDITERKQRQNRIVQLAAIVESSNDAIFSTSLDGTITSWNRSAVGVFDYTESEILGKSVATLIPDDRIDELPQVLGRIGKGEYVEAFDSVACGKDGKRVDVSLAISPVWDADGKLLGASTIARDITEQKRAETERAKLQSQMLHAQKLESLGVLAGGIAHDFNNMLTSAMGYASLALLELPLDSPARPMLVEIENAAHRAAELTGQMLAYSGKGQFVIQPIRLDTLVNEMLRLLNTVVSKKANIVLDLNPVIIQGDATQIRQVIMNVITNASDSLEGMIGEIQLRTGMRKVNGADLRTPHVPEAFPGGTCAFIEIRDNGCGMSEETLSRIFDPFFTTKFTGRGLGLAAVLGIVRGHHGTIKVESIPGKGTTFELFFPCAVAMASEGSDSDIDRLPRGQGTILVIEDEQNVRNFAQLLLKKAGFNVRTAEDGRSGINTYLEYSHEIAAILLDLTMPRMDGLEVLQELRDMASEVPVLVMSGYSEQEFSMRCAKTGANGFIQKPFNPHDLIKRICELLDQPFEASQT
jgi:PAS domain S-box-containing protein